MSDVTIRPANGADVPAIARIWRMCPATLGRGFYTRLG
jgi:hypothetical protein